ncbi:MAG: sulfatase-like hydrolase/transferase [Bacilli bacterium]|nr:sulfatase-like hydrolase/transferase [Bacilli bacterium]
MKVLKRINKIINKENIIKYLDIILDFIKEYKYIIYMALPFIVMDIIIRFLAKDIDFYGGFELSTNLFITIWIFLFLGLSLTLKKKIGKIIYLSTSILFTIFFLINSVYFGMTKTFFDFNLLESTSEGMPYVIDTLKNTNILIYISFISILFLIRKGYKSIPYKTRNNYINFSKVIIIFILIHSLIPITLGKANSELTWSTWKNPRNIYISFNDSNKSMKVSGIYEYTVRNFYITFLKTKEQENSEDIEFLNTAFSSYEGEHNNKYTGIFKDKNLIFIQLEGLDNWLLTEEDTPTLYNMLNNSYNFNNHYSYYNGGGSTFNSEFAVNTGFITPLSYTQNAYTFNKNNFPYSMANLFKKEGYTINAFHMNTGEYYSRTTNYLNWGYDNYYGLIDIEDYKTDAYKLDRELILNEQFNNHIFNTENKFVDYIITYSGHMPFTNTKGVCKALYNLDKEEEILLNESLNQEVNNQENNQNEETTDTLKEEVKEEFIQMTEMECIKRQAKETDYMMELLLQNLRDKNLIDNTVIVVFTDHYLYTIEDKSILDNYKETSNNLINKTPFFIWSNNTKKTDINKVTSQLNILPTTLNLFGIDYNPNNYIGEDALNPNYEGIVFFSDYSWYDGNVFVENAIVTNNKNISYEKLEEKNYYISYITKKNDLALKYNYFKNIK